MVGNEAAFAAMLADLDVEESLWKPETPGDQVYGEVTAIEYVRTKQGTTLPMVKVRTPAGDLVKVAAGRAAIRNELDRRKVQAGDLVAIRYLGLVEGKDGGRDFHGYRVAHKPLGARDASAAFNGATEVADDLGLVAGAVDGTFGAVDGTFTDVPAGF